MDSTLRDVMRRVEAEERAKRNGEEWVDSPFAWLHPVIGTGESGKIMERIVREYMVEKGLPASNIQETVGKSDEGDMKIGDSVILEIKCSTLQRVGIFRFNKIYKAGGLGNVDYVLCVGIHPKLDPLCWVLPVKTVSGWVEEINHYTVLKNQGKAVTLAKPYTGICRIHNSGEWALAFDPLSNTSRRDYLTEYGPHSLEGVADWLETVI